jgi:hypothetical protein
MEYLIVRNPIPLIGRSLHTQRIGGELVKVLKWVFRSGLKPAKLSSAFLTSYSFA